MKKSLIIIASALVLAVGAASTGRLRYDSTVFADSDQSVGGARTTRLEYPPCIKGVREDRCIQLYERGVRRSYQRWLAANGRPAAQTAAAGPARAYRPCRSRRDDNCQQQAHRTPRTARAIRTARNLRAQQVQQRAAPQRGAPQRIARQRRAIAAPQAAPSRALQRVARQIRPTTPAPRPRNVTRPAPGGGSTPGI
jgi:hypothetical protein